MVRGFAAQGNIQHGEHGLVEALAGVDVLDHQLDVIDETAAMEFLRFHALLSFAAESLLARPPVPAVNTLFRREQRNA